MSEVEGPERSTGTLTVALPTSPSSTVTSPTRTVGPAATAVPAVSASSPPVLITSAHSVLPHRRMSPPEPACRPFLTGVCPRGPGEATNARGAPEVRRGQATDSVRSRHRSTGAGSGCGTTRPSTLHTVENMIARSRPTDQFST